MSARVRRVVVWQTRRRTVLRPGRSRTRRASTGFATSERRVVYVGKAKNLRSRLTSYFQDIVNLHPRTATMVSNAASVDWTVVNTEVEALQLEYSWIKEFDPRFNVKYRDDKSYPWLAVTLNEEFPRVMVGRGAKKRGVRYFGPYSHAWAIRETVDLLLRVFPMRSCSNGVFKRSGPDRPAVPARLHRQVRRPPASGGCRAEEHRAIVDDFCDFMAGHTTAFVKRLEKQMYAASEATDYERAARLRDDIGALNRALEKQQVVLRRRHRRRRRRVLRGPARGGGADLLRPRRPHPRPARLGGRQGRRRRHRRARRALPAPAVRRRAQRSHPAGGARARAARGHPGPRAVAGGPAGRPGVDQGAAAG